MKKPKRGFFAEDGDMPDEQALAVPAPPAYTNEEWNRVVGERVAEVEN